MPLEHIPCCVVSLHCLLLGRHKTKQVTRDETTDIQSQKDAEQQARRHKGIVRMVLVKRLLRICVRGKPSTTTRGGHQFACKAQ